MGMPALAMTDHGNVFGAYDFYKQAKAAGVNPIIGMEGYLAPGSRFERKRAALTGATIDGNAGEMYTHMTLLAENTAGMHNLFKLSSLASLEGYYYKPRMDRELLQTYANGIIATTGCPSGEVNRLLQQGQYELAKQAASDYRDIFGPENFYCELMDHGIDIERRHRDDLMRLARELQLPFVATNDLHYTYAKDWEAHEVLLCVQTGKTMADPNRLTMGEGQLYLKTPQEMRELFREIPEACDNTLAIAERVHVEFNEGANLMPNFPVPAGESEESWLVKEVELGLHKRFPLGVPDAHRQQANYELGVIGQMGFPGYFLVVADLVRYAQTSGIRVGPGRGSAVGSMVSYALGITQLDPIHHKLLFERFLNPERISMPDIDMDFDERRRGDMIRYATEKYGEERVAQIITYGTIKAKQAVKDSARVLGFPFATSDQITKVMPPPLMGKDVPLAGIFDPDHPRYSEAGEFRALYEANPDVKKVVDTARDLEGLKRQWGVHAAGVILSREPLLDVIPIHRRDQDGAIITQFDMGACEALGLLKMDFLGLRNLTILDDCLAGIKNNRGERSCSRPSISMPTRTPTTCSAAATRSASSSSRAAACARCCDRCVRPPSPTSLPSVRSTARARWAPTRTTTTPIARTAASRSSRSTPNSPSHSMRFSARPTACSCTKSRCWRSRRRSPAIHSARPTCCARRWARRRRRSSTRSTTSSAQACASAATAPAPSRRCGTPSCPFSDYGFNKAHSAGYGVVSYWTAYLKANYPAEYMAALLTSVKDDKDKSALYLHECRRMGIKVLAARRERIRLELHPTRHRHQVRPVGDPQRRRERGRLDHRDAPDQGPLQGLRRLPGQGRAGGMQQEGRRVAHQGRVVRFARAHATRAWSLCTPTIIDAAMGTKRAEAVGQFDLFGSADDDQGPAGLGLAFEIVIPSTEWDKTALLAAERDMLGLYVSDHPLFGIEHVLRGSSTARSAR